MKVFRKVTPGRQPRHRDPRGADPGRLRRTSPRSTAGSTRRRRRRRRDLQLAMLQQFLRTATDGWDLALASVRNLFAEADLHADEVGGDFAGEAARLGAALAEVHADAAPSTSPTEPRAAAAIGALADAHDAAGSTRPSPSCPSSRRTPSALRATFDAAARRSTASTVQRIHGDLHLGQTLRTVKGWKIVDFEGEPAKPLAERLLPDSPLARRRRDAALLRLRRRAWSSATLSDQRRRRRRAARLPGRASGPSATATPSCTAYAGRRADRRRARSCSTRVRRRQGRLRGRLRGPQPPDLGGHPARRPSRDGSESHDHPSPPPPTPSTVDELDQLVARRARRPARRPRPAPVRRRRHRPRASAAGPQRSTVRYGDARRSPLDARARGRLGRRARRVDRTCPTTGSRSTYDGGAASPSTTPTASCRRSASSTCT